MKSLKDILFNELGKLHDAETQISVTLPKIIEGISNEQLKENLAIHLGQTKNHIARLKSIQSQLQITFSEKSDVMKSLIASGEKIISDEYEPTVKEAAIIGAIQKVEHYEIASYGTAIAWAKTLNLEEIATILVDTLIEEKEADSNLSKLAEGGIIQSGINEQAADAGI